MFFWNARARKTHIEATLNHPFLPRCHHTFARLYSADGRWRRDPDFVAFAVHRAAAAGDAQFRAYAAAQLPAAVPASVLPGLPPSRALFLRFDDG